MAKTENSDERVSRRSALGVLSAALPLDAVPGARQTRPNPFAKVAAKPDHVFVFNESGSQPLVREGLHWQSGSISLEITPGDNARIFVRAPQEWLIRIQLRWSFAVPEKLLILGDHWERSYGDLAWRSIEPERILPWYFLSTDGKLTCGCGVATGAAAFAFWQLDTAGVSLWLDVRNGGGGVRLGERRLQVATKVVRFEQDISAFALARKFCAQLCSSPRLPKLPVYGGNNWYYAYGRSSARDILEDSERIASVATATENRPFMVIDDGWQLNSTAGPWTQGNQKFPDMAGLAGRMNESGVHPGIWVRPLFTKEQVEQGWRLEHPNAAKEFARNRAYTLDPTVPGVAAKIRDDLSLLRGWGYRLIKHDFSTYDLLGRWGFAMGAELTEPGWHFADETKTNAEIIRELYRIIREAVGDSLILGCNTVGHLGAGLFEISRTGDDTSGRDWNRTRKMGVNTLAFRSPQHETFFSVDADCVGLTKEVPWKFNQQWLDLLAFSGTALFVSAAPDAFGTEQRDAIRRAFAIAAVHRPVAEPLDWLSNSQPVKWKNGTERKNFDWFGENGTSPFSR